MTNLPAKIQADIMAFMSRTMDNVSGQALVNAQEKARIPAWKGNMEKGIHLGNRSGNKVSVIAYTNQAYLFETGYRGEVDVTPLLKQWGADKKVRIPASGKFNVNFRRRPTLYKFMFKSIPSKAQTKPLVDEAFSQTIRGGTV